MILLRPVSNEEMVATFLRAEIDSDQRGPAVLEALRTRDAPESLIRSPDLGDDAANRERSAILGACRGWQRDEGLFIGFPADTSWFVAHLERAEVGEVFGASLEAWRTLAGPTRRVDHAAAAALDGEIDDPDARQLAQRAKSCAQRYQHGDALGPPILLTSTFGGPRVAVEGHARLIAWFLAARPEPLETILGFCDEPWSWLYF